MKFYNQVTVTLLHKSDCHLEDALAPYYGEDAEVLGDLMLDHLVIAAEILRAAKAKQPLDGLIASWYANAHDIAAQMNAPFVSSFGFNKVFSASTIRGSALIW